MIKTTHLKPFALATLFAFSALQANAQFSFSNSNSLLSSTTMRSGCAVTVVDVNNDGLDDILRMDQSTTLHLELQNMDGTFSHTNLGNISGTSRVWAMAAADVDQNGWKDVVTGVNGACYLVKLFESGGVVTSTTTTLAGSYFVQNITFGDIDNDGWVDVFVCDDNDYSKIYKNNSGTLSLTTTMMNTAPGAPTMYGGDPADSGNYGSVWTDFDNDGDLDLFVAHCRQSTSSSTDLRRKDRMFVNNGSNVYTEAAATYGIEITDFKQTWTASFGDIDNDGDFDLLVTNHGENGQILENNGSGYFTALTGTGFTTSIDPIESILEDFDNDGFLDILITGSSWYMWHNNGDKTFTAVGGSVFAALGGMLSFATGDLNHDGKIDLFTSYGNIYNTPSGTDNDVLYMNTNNNGNHFITFNLTGTTSNVDAVGARATIYGPWGTQIREVRAGETYGTSNSMQLHFGIGSNTSIDSARIDWPAGGSTPFGTLAADQFITVVEGGCSITGNVVPGPYAFCTGGSVTLTAASGYTSYLWSNSASTQSINSSVTDTYSVMVTSGACSNISPSVTTVLNPDETPTVSSAGASSCEGVVTLSSTPASAYSWTGPGGFTASTQSINPSTSGTYSVTITGLCGNFTSAPSAVTVTSAPAPTGTGAVGPGPASFNLSAAATGGSLTWYDLPSAGTMLATGTAYTT
ncbi:MAG: FG-GAP-like repeat-containing protein, partial [Bacteroidota bacterium]|nr:FG-GAP-like repeat-containing protein [Bacteroidota bacterium]